jgi:hypothetical protein
MRGKGWMMTVGIALILTTADRAFVAADDAQSASDDGWRRTATGWVHVDALQAEVWGIPRRQPDRFITEEQSQSHSQRWDFHPAILALGQMMVAAAAFAGVRRQIQAMRNSGG